MKFLTKILNAIYDDKFSCFSCGGEKLDPNSFLCPSCLKGLHLITYPCQICGSQVNSFTNVCEDCRQEKVHHTYDKVIASATFEDTARTLVYKFKYGKDKSIAKAIIPFMCDTLSHSSFLPQIDFVLPVPLAKERLKERGFNQSLILAKGICDKFNLPLFDKCVLRVRDTVTQTSLNREERIDNLKNAFEFSDKSFVKGKTILIVDDLSTSGATMDEISTLLKKNGASCVYGLAFCHA